MYLGHVLAPTLGISKLTWQNSHYRKQNIFVDMFWQVLIPFWHVLTLFWHFLTIFWPTDRHMDRWIDGPILYDMFWHFFDMFWHFFDSFWHFWHFFDRQTDRQTDIQNLDVEAPARSLKISNDNLTRYSFVQRASFTKSF